jgi:hypothetical protein
LKFAVLSPKSNAAAYPIEAASGPDLKEFFGNGGPTMERVIPTIVPSIAPDSPDLVLDRLIHPARFFSHPEEVLRDDTLDVQEKRAILSSWASDACAVESIPALRKPPGAAAPVSFDAIMDALRHLDNIRREDVTRRDFPGDGEAINRLDA